jgi:hypothetical protein
MNFPFAKLLKFELLMLILGIFAGIGFLVVGSYPLLDSWDFVSKVPKTATQLIYDYPHFYVKTSDNLIYSCQGHSRHICEPIKSYVEPQDIYKYHFCGEPNSLTPLVPGTVTASLVVRECAPDGHVDIHIIALEDGSIWEWYQFSGGLGSELIPLMFIAIGAVGGLAVGIPLFAFWHLFRPSARMKAKNNA